VFICCKLRFASRPVGTAADLYVCSAVAASTSVFLSSPVACVYWLSKFAGKLRFVYFSSLPAREWPQ